MQTKTILTMLLVLSSSLAYAQLTMVLIDEMTTVEMEQAFKAGKNTLIMYVGAYHENKYRDEPGPIFGPNRDSIVVGKHNILAQYLVRRVAVELGDALALGAIPYTANGFAVGQDKGQFTGELGPKAGHMAFAGTIGVTDRTQAAMLDDIASSAIISSRGGFKNVVILGDNGGGQIDRKDPPYDETSPNPLRDAVEAIGRRWAPKGVKVLYFPVYAASKRECAKTLAKLPLPQEFRPGVMGCNVPIDDAAELLALDQEGRYVRKEKLPPAAARFITPALGMELLEQKVRIAVEMIRREIPAKSAGSQ